MSYHHASRGISGSEDIFGNVLQTINKGLQTAGDVIPGLTDLLSGGKKKAPPPPPPPTIFTPMNIGLALGGVALIATVVVLTKKKK